jgi:hypothetical protein
MKFFRKCLFSFATVAFLAFVSILAIESAHHHDNFESHNDCSLCAWQLTGSSAPSTPTTPILFHALIFVSLVIFTPLFISLFQSFPSLSRAPPKNLL